MKATSIHLKACDIGSAEAHNKREKELDYIRKDLSELNESFSYTDKTLPAIEAEIRREVKAKTGRKLQKNAIPIKEGVMVIDENTTLKDLQNFCQECRDKFGMIPLSIDIHRDEGYMNSKDWKRNLHAHITWRMYDENGRNVRLSKQDMSDMQTMAAHHLHMARGKSSDKKHLSSIQYKIKAETERLKSIENAIEMAESKLSKKGAKGVYNAIRDHLAGDMKKELEKTKEALETANKAILEQSGAIEAMERDNNAQNDTNARLLDKLNKQTQDIANVEAIRAEKEQAERKVEELEAIEEKLREELRDVNKKRQNMIEKLNLVKENLDAVDEQTRGLGLSLSTADKVTIASGYFIKVKEFRHPDFKNGSEPISLSKIGEEGEIFLEFSDNDKELKMDLPSCMKTQDEAYISLSVKEWVKRFIEILSRITAKLTWEKQQETPRKQPQQNRGMGW